VFQGFRSDYNIFQDSDSQYTITDNVENRDGSDTVTNVEHFQFADGTIDELDIMTTMDSGSGAESEQGWAESVQADDSGSAAPSDNVWGPSENSSSAESDHASSAMDPTPDTSSVVAMNESANGGMEGSERMEG